MAITASMSSKVVEVKLDKESQNTTIIAAGDFHIGCKSFNKTAFNNFVQQMQSLSKLNPTYLLLMGDIFDSISVTDKRFNPEERDMNMDDSQDFFSRAFQPLLKTGNFHIIGSLLGNHELKFCRGDVDPIYILYRNTGIEPLGIKCYIYFDFLNKGVRRGTLRTVAFHGCSNSRTDQGKVRIVREFLNDNQLTEDDFIRLNQIAFYGHTHSCRVERIIKVIPNPRLKETVMHTQYSCLTGSLYDTSGFLNKSYATEKGYNPLPLGYIKVTASLTDDLQVETVFNDLNPTVKAVHWSAM